MKIYTRTGDSGQTSLLGGARVPKHHLRIAAYGDIDELNATIGFVLSQSPTIEVADILTHVQHRLFDLGSELASPEPERFNLPLITDAHVSLLETSIDTMEAALQPLRNFVLPGGTPAAAALHIARTVCRRAERSTTYMAEHIPLRPVVITYINRLSDYLFVASRYENQKAGYTENIWKP
jgi:cob(I)alamin adenosyltransferase